MFDFFSGVGPDPPGKLSPPVRYQGFSPVIVFLGICQGVAGMLAVGPGRPKLLSPPKPLGGGYLLWRLVNWLQDGRGSLQNCFAPGAVFFAHDWVPGGYVYRSRFVCLAEGVGRSVWGGGGVIGQRGYEWGGEVWGWVYSFLSGPTHSPPLEPRRPMQPHVATTHSLLYDPSPRPHPRGGGRPGGVPRFGVAVRPGGGDYWV